MLLQGCYSGGKSRAHVAFQILYNLTDRQMLPKEDVESTLKKILDQGMHIVPQLLCPKATPGTPGQDDALVAMGKLLFM